MSELRRNLHKKQIKYLNRCDNLGLSGEDAPDESTIARRRQVNKEFSDHLWNQKKKLLPIQEKFFVDNSHFLQTYFSPSKQDDSLVLVFLHGAGSSSLTFLPFISLLKQDCEGSEPGIFMFDMFGHGLSTDRKANNYGLEALTDDFKFALDNLMNRFKIQNMCFIGHSLGGSIMSSFLARKGLERYPVLGLILLDAVEETAIRSLTLLPALLDLRPKQFNLYDEAIDWHLRTKLLRNEKSARLSVPDLFVEDNEGTLFWRTDLRSMAVFWDDWFDGMSSKFLRCEGSLRNIAKLIILAGGDHLDKNLIIGQMQGKYQLIVFGSSSASEEVGHFIQEDSPRKLCVSILEFLNRQKIDKSGVSRSSIKTLWGGDVH